MDPFVGEVRAVGFNFAPQGWAMCNGQLMPILQNTALFSLLGTSFGGDGQSTFGLPNLQAQFPVGAGQTESTYYPVGSQDGASRVTLNLANLPPHRHLPTASAEPGSTNAPDNAVWAQPHYGRATDPVYATSGATSAMAASALDVTGGNAAHNNLPPFLVVNFIIALQGVFPPRQ
ncbi:MAG: phage tail protein [Jatrophihabitans sp.]|jgi:microcystin-dependent protein|nr:phage tail protein [Jatrophihabitans sp.]